MATQSWIASTKGADDFELGIPRVKSLVYHCTAPAEGKAEGLVFVIPDFNDDVDGEAFVKLREYLAQTYGLIAVSVEYHCYRSRLRDGATLDISNDEFRELSRICMQKGVALLDRNALMYALGQLEEPYEIQFRVSPTNNEYLNFGLMEALDHIAVLRDFFSRSDQRFNHANILALGAGYGGYLAQMLAKLAPNTLRAVIEYSGYVTPPESYLFGDAAGSGLPPYYYHVGNMRIAPLLPTKWEMKPESTAYYSITRREIRDISNARHLSVIAHQVKRRCQYRLGSLLLDGQDLRDAKRAYTATLADLGFDVKLVAEPETDLLRIVRDNKGDWGVLLQTLFDREYPELATNYGNPDWEGGTSVGYLCAEGIYGFEHGEWGCLANFTPVNISEL